MKQDESQQEKALVADLLHQYEYEISTFLPNEIRETKRLMKKFPGLQEAGKEYIESCTQLILATKEKFKKLQKSV